MFLASALLIFFRKRNSRALRLSSDSWNMKPFSILTFNEQEIISSIRPENLVGKGGSGEVYRVVLRSGHVVAVKHVTKLKNLWQLELYNNSFTGEIPAGFGNLSNLAFFDASMNQLTGDLSELRHLSGLVSLQLYYNNFYGSIPQEFGDFRKLVNLSLYNNQLTGQIPVKLGSRAEFNFIDVSSNFPTGPIPPDMCRMGTMKKLLMLDNQLSGEIPASYTNCSSLIQFRVSNNGNIEVHIDRAASMDSFVQPLTSLSVDVVFQGYRFNGTRELATMMSPLARSRDVDHLIGGNFLNKCYIPKHKLQ